MTDKKLTMLEKTRLFEELSKSNNITDEQEQWVIRFAMVRAAMIPRYTGRVYDKHRSAQQYVNKHVPKFIGEYQDEGESDLE